VLTGRRNELHTKYEDAYVYVAHQGCGCAPRHRPMAPANLSIWRQCLQELQRLPEVLGNSTNELAAYQKISAQMRDWEALPALSASAWRALVLDLEVTRRFCTVARLAAWQSMDIKFSWCLHGYPYRKAAMRSVYQ